jgi:hypothetical protein
MKPERKPTAAEKWRDLDHDERRVVIESLGAWVEYWKRSGSGRGARRYRIAAAVLRAAARSK